MVAASDVLDHNRAMALVGSSLLGLALCVGVAAVAAARTSVPLFVALGDSTAKGYGSVHGGYVDRLHARLQETVPALTLRNFAENGATSSDVLARQLPKLASLRPTLVTIGIGVNDLTRQLGPAVFERNLTAIVEGARRTGAAVVLVNLPDVSLAPAVPPFLRAPFVEKVRAYNAVVARVATNHRVSLVDLFRHSREHLPQHPEYFAPDGFHPSDAGQASWAELMWPVVRAAVAGGA